MILKDARIYANGYDYSGVTNQVALERSAAALDATTMDSGGAMERAAGLVTDGLTISGIHEKDLTADGELFASVGLDAGVMVVAASQDGAKAWAHQGVLLSYVPTGTIGELYSFSAAIAANGVLTPGRLLLAASDVTGDGESSSVDLGAFAANDTLAVAVQVLSVAGGAAVEVAIESDTDETFTAPTIEAVFSNVAQGGHWQLAAGANTNTRYRATWSVTGADPTARIAVFVGRYSTSIT